MKKPKMILFDYGETLLNESFDGIKGTEAVLKYATKNPHHYTAEKVQYQADQIIKELDQYHENNCQIEVTTHAFNAYLYESLDIELSISYKQAEHIFWNTAGHAVLTDGIIECLEQIYYMGIRTGVISNISVEGSLLKEKIKKYLPNHHFEFILASSDYLFRKPSKHIFELALKKASLSAQEVWYIGDNYNCDIIGAKKAGLYPIWYRGAIDAMQHMDTIIQEKEKNNHAGCQTINRWEELLTLLKNPTQDTQEEFAQIKGKETHKEKARRLFLAGYNCAQSVFVAYSDVYGIEEKTALKISSSFGAGVGRMRELCGCASGMFLIAGMETGNIEGSREKKAYNYEIVQKMANAFKQKSGGSIICRELLGLEKAQESAIPEERTKEYYKKRPCLMLIQDACDVIEEMFPKYRE